MDLRCIQKQIQSSDRKDALTTNTDGEDRLCFVSRMGQVAAVTGTSIYAWALLTNHAHILLKSGAAGLLTFMRKLPRRTSVYVNSSSKIFCHICVILDALYEKFLISGFCNAF
ncbi:hypothetical protein Cpha266_1503 [Chlorobium phaeobacteroides DSM 266]|uniref:Transposase IS200-like domain-containing protein n=1 Tax=Chlorobium phaeobacteroides (strain DSM 266 / SMG 266 / 2430) TaxID=290317 RepID=A1BGJ8_CHLPD|nr:hypothetical protein Cpha266_1503 [Chlorobium phaeobacteroides DSM 266]